MKLKIVKEFPPYKEQKIGDKIITELEDDDNIPTLWERVVGGWVIRQRPCDEGLIER